MPNDSKPLPLIYEVEPPHFEWETKVPAYDYIARRLAEHFGRMPHRRSIENYIKTKRKIHGQVETRLFPVFRGGPYVRLPVVQQLYYWYTSTEAMDRFINTVKKAQREWQRRVSSAA